MRSPCSTRSAQATCFRPGCRSNAWEGKRSSSGGRHSAGGAMRRAVTAVMAVVIAVLAVGVFTLNSKFKQESARYAETKQAEESVRSQFNSALESIAEIQDSLSAITPGNTPVRS